MKFSVLPHIKQRIMAAFEENLARYPGTRTQLEAYLQGREETFTICLQYLYGHMPANDMLSFEPEMFGSFVEATLTVMEKMPHLQRIPQEIFFPYVLFHRVNSECLDASRGYLMDRILPFVQGKSMQDAALTVNYWCLAHATYAPADDRTLGPLAVLRGSRGRCGEESVLAVSALRSVGIPARQVYCPRWSHCDDNHAWVEFWANGTWHYFGACEPEAQPDSGWFTSAASRAMLIHTHCWADFGLEPALTETPLRQEISRTAHYAKTRTLRVQVLNGGEPAAGVQVDFQIVNYAELFTLHSCLTDAHGIVTFETGLGELCVSVGGRVQKVQGDRALVELTEAQKSELTFDLVPPVGRYDVEPGMPDMVHEEKRRQCQDNLFAIRSGFHDPQIAGNQGEIQAFVQDPRWQAHEKQLLLLTLLPKDFVDITAETLVDAMETENRYDRETYQKYVLAPRVRLEMLNPERKTLRAMFPEGFADAREILAWMKENMHTVPHFGVDNYDPSPLGCLRNRQVPEGAFGLVFVALCRAFGFAARLAPDTGAAQWMDGAGKWCSVKPELPYVCLTLENRGKPLCYGEHFSLAQWNGSAFMTLRYPGQTLTDHWQLDVEPGQYRLITVTRQIDGTASTHIRDFLLQRDTTISLEIPQDQMAQKLKRERLAPPEGPLAAALSDMAGQKGLLLLAEPGAEPTEHLLQELLECADGYEKGNYPIRVFVAEQKELDNATLRRVGQALPQVKAVAAKDMAGEKYLRYSMQVGDLRLPFVLAVDGEGHGVYATANYNIRMAQTLLQVLQFMGDGLTENGESATM